MNSLKGSIMSFGGFLKRKRKEVGLTQEELAFHLGLSNKSSISQYENDKMLPDQSRIGDYRKLLGCNFEEFYSAYEGGLDPKELEDLEKRKEQVAVQFNSVEELWNVLVAANKL